MTGLKPSLFAGPFDCQFLWTLQAKRDNDSVYFQHVPAADALPVIEPRRLVTSTPYALPVPAMLVTEALLDAFVEVPAEKVCSHLNCRSYKWLPHYKNGLASWAGGSLNFCCMMLACEAALPLGLPRKLNRALCLHSAFLFLQIDFRLSHQQQCPGWASQVDYSKMHAAGGQVGWGLGSQHSSSRQAGC